MLRGNSGVGKTTILEAIVWCLTGDTAYHLDRCASVAVRIGDIWYVRRTTIGVPKQMPFCDKLLSSGKLCATYDLEHNEVDAAWFPAAKVMAAYSRQGEDHILVNSNWLEELIFDGETPEVKIKEYNKHMTNLRNNVANIKNQTIALEKKFDSRRHEELSKLADPECRLVYQDDFNSMISRAERCSFISDFTQLFEDFEPYGNAEILAARDRSQDLKKQAVCRQYLDLASTEGSVDVDAWSAYERYRRIADKFGEPPHPKWDSIVSWVKNYEELRQMTHDWTLKYDEDSVTRWNEYEKWLSRNESRGLLEQRLSDVAVELTKCLVVSQGWTDAQKFRRCHEYLCAQSKLRAMTEGGKRYSQFDCHRYNKWQKYLKLKAVIGDLTEFDVDPKTIEAIETRERYSAYKEPVADDALELAELEVKRKANIERKKLRDSIVVPDVTWSSLEQLDAAHKNTLLVDELRTKVGDKVFDVESETIVRLRKVVKGIPRDVTHEKVVAYAAILDATQKMDKITENGKYRVVENLERYLIMKSDYVKNEITKCSSFIKTNQVPRIVGNEIPNLKCWACNQKQFEPVADLTPAEVATRMEFHTRRRTFDSFKAKYPDFDSLAKMDVRNCLTSLESVRQYNAAAKIKAEALLVTGGAEYPMCSVPDVREAFGKLDGDDGHEIDLYEDPQSARDLKAKIDPTLPQVADYESERELVEQRDKSLKRLNEIGIVEDVPEEPFSDKTPEEIRTHQRYHELYAAAFAKVGDKQAVVCDLSAVRDAFANIPTDVEEIGFELVPDPLCAQMLAQVPAEEGDAPTDESEFDKMYESIVTGKKLASEKAELASKLSQVSQDVSMVRPDPIVRDPEAAKRIHCENPGVSLDEAREIERYGHEYRSFMSMDPVEKPSEPLLANWEEVKAARNIVAENECDMNDLSPLELVVTKYDKSQRDFVVKNRPAYEEYKSLKNPDYYRLNCEWKLSCDKATNIEGNRSYISTNSAIISQGVDFIDEVSKMAADRRTVYLEKFNSLLMVIMDRVFVEHRIGIRVVHTRTRYEIEVSKPGVSKMYYRGLSGGQKARVSLAMSIASAKLSGTPFVLFDETLGHVDSNTIAPKCIEVIDELLGDRCIGVVTHDEVLFVDDANVIECV